MVNGRGCPSALSQRSMAGTPPVGAPGQLSESCVPNPLPHPPAWQHGYPSTTPSHAPPCRVVICGGGIIGAATAYYLARTGGPEVARRVMVVEREAPACAASGRHWAARRGCEAGLSGVVKTVCGFMCVYCVVVVGVGGSEALRLQCRAERMPAEPLPRCRYTHAHAHVPSAPMRTFRPLGIPVLSSKSHARTRARTHAGKAGGFLALDWNDSSPVGPLARLSYRLHPQLAAELREQLGRDVGYRTVHTWQVGRATR